ncbi:MAG: hypothetical protein JSV06_08365, partial [Myxococcales bacterium]
MGRVPMRVIWFGGVVLVAACGSKQTPGATTVSSGGAECHGQPVVADDSPVAGAEVADPEAVTGDLEESRGDLDHAGALDEQTDRRDIRMMSYEEAMSLPFEIGDATIQGGEEHLNVVEIARVMDAHLDEMYDECIEKELRRGNELGTVTIDLAIRGKDGMILG